MFEELLDGKMNALEEKDLSGMSSTDLPNGTSRVNMEGDQSVQKRQQSIMVNGVLIMKRACNVFHVDRNNMD